MKTPVVVPILLDMSEFKSPLVQREEQEIVYALYGVITHEESKDASRTGHYTAIGTRKAKQKYTKEGRRVFIS